MSDSGRGTIGDCDHGGKSWDCPQCIDKETIAQLRQQLAVACHIKADNKVGFDFAVLGRISELEQQLATVTAERDRIVQLLDAFIDARETAPMVCGELWRNLCDAAGLNKETP